MRRNCIRYDMLQYESYRAKGLFGILQKLILPIFHGRCCRIFVVMPARISIVVFFS